MIIGFANNRIEKICNNSKEAFKEFGNKKVVKHLAELMLDLHATKHIEPFYTNPIFKKYRAHELIGDKKGITSLSVDYAYRMTIIVEIQVVEDEITILEVNKHYGD